MVDACIDDMEGFETQIRLITYINVMEMKLFITIYQLRA